MFRLGGAIAVVFLLSISLKSPAYGMIRARYFDEVGLALSRSQTAIISHKNGVEKMAVAVNIDLSKDDEPLLVLPVPGEPGDVKVGTLGYFPVPDWRPVSAIAEDVITGSMALASATQIYPPFVYGLFMPTYMRHGGYMRRGDPPTLPLNTRPDKFGIEMEAFKPRSTQELAAYLKGKGMAASEERLKAIAPYLTGEYSIVVAWVSSMEKLTRRFPVFRARGKNEYERELYVFEALQIEDHGWPSLYIEFPTDKAYFPLRPARMYGEKNVDVNLIVFRHVKPAADKTKYTLDMDHCLDTDFFQKYSGFFSEDVKDKQLYFTLVRGELKASDLVEDLRFEPYTSGGVGYALLIINNWSLWFLPLIVMVFSYASAGFAGLMVYGKWRGYARLGLWNMLTIAGLLNALRRKTGGGGRRLTLRHLIWPASIVILFAAVALIMSAASESFRLALGEFTTGLSNTLSMHSFAQYATALIIVISVLFISISCIMLPRRLGRDEKRFAIYFSVIYVLLVVITQAMLELPLYDTGDMAMQTTAAALALGQSLPLVMLIARNGRS